MKLSDCKLDHDYYRIPSRTILEENEPLVMPFSVGGLIEGTGGGQLVDPKGHFGPRGAFTSSDSAIARVGDNLGPLVHLQGVNWTLQRLTLLGRQFGDTTPGRPKAGVLISSPILEGLGSGKHRLQQLFIDNVDEAIVMGESMLEKNCDCLVVDQVQAHDCRAFLRTNNIMSMDNNVRDIHCQDVDVIFDIHGGGKFKADGVTLVAVQEGKKSVVLRLGEGFGSNNRTYVVRDVCLDQQCGPRVAMLEMTTPKNAHFRFEGGHIDNDDYVEAGQPLWTLKGGYLEISGWENLPRGAIHNENHGKEPNEVVLRGNTLAKCATVKEIFTKDSDWCYFTAANNRRHGELVKGDKSDGKHLGAANWLTPPRIAA